MTNFRFSAKTIRVHRDYVIVTGKDGDEIRYDIDGEVDLCYCSVPSAMKELKRCKPKKN